MDSTPRDGTSDHGHGLMPPPPSRAPKRGREVVLEEEEWVAKMDGIIERDFFPELGRLQDKVAWLEAVRSGDSERIRQAQLQIAHRRQSLHQQQQQLQQNTQYRQGQQQTPSTRTRGRNGGYTPYNTDFQPHSAGDLNGGGINGDDGISIPPVSLDTFLASHTSEDNASFHDILEKTNKRRRERVIATLGAPSNDPTLLLTDGKERTDGFGTSGQPIDTQPGWKYTAKNMLMYDGSTRNSLALSKRELAGLVPGPPPAINHSATRLHQQVQRHAKLLHAAGGGAGSDTTSIDTESTGAEMTEEEEEKGRRGDQSAPGVRGGVAGRANNYDILATPSFDPGVDASPLITWGNIEATPMRIEAEDLPPGGLLSGSGNGGKATFKITESSKRERKALELARKAGATLRNRPGGVGLGRSGSAHTPARAAALAALGRTPASTRGDGGNNNGPGGATPLSHAAQKLVGKMKKSQNTGTDAALRASYTPRHGGGGGGGGRRKAGGGRKTPLSGWESEGGTPSLGAI
ncbi:hypothetical protein Ndes2526B_g04255 [Nannochloris sp. 'desiccata']